MSFEPCLVPPTQPINTPQNTTNNHPITAVKTEHLILPSLPEESLSPTNNVSSSLPSSFIETYHDTSFYSRRSCGMPLWVLFYVLGCWRQELLQVRYLLSLWCLVTSNNLSIILWGPTRENASIGCITRLKRRKSKSIILYCLRQSLLFHSWRKLTKLFFWIRIPDSIGSSLRWRYVFSFVIHHLGIEGNTLVYCQDEFYHNRSEGRRSCMCSDMSHAMN